MIDLTETNLLPTWPFFFQGQVISGVSEKEDIKNADYVWVAATPDFSLGYIMGLANTYEASGAANKFSKSYNYTGLVEGLAKRGILQSDTDYRNLYVQYWNENYIEMVDSKFGDKYIILSNGTITAIHRNQIYMRVGADNQPFSAIRMSGSEISFATNTFRVKANHVLLGEKGLYVAAMGASVPASVEGITFSPQTNIMV
jgi:hypothetical protein